MRNTVATINTNLAISDANSNLFCNLPHVINIKVNYLQIINNIVIRICFWNSWVMFIVSQASEKRGKGENNHENNSNDSRKSVGIPTWLSGIEKKSSR